MAELLILAVQDPKEDPNIGKNLGDVIDIKPDGHRWTSSEGLPKFWRVIITGATVEQCAAYVEQLDAELPDGTFAPVKLRTRRLSYQTLPNPIKNQLNNNGFITVTKAQADSYIARIA